MSLRSKEANSLLNDASGVYVFADDSRDLPVYVGRCSSFGSRIASHFNKQYNAGLHDFLNLVEVKVSLLLIALATNDESDVPSRQRTLRRVAKTDHDYPAIIRLEGSLIVACLAVNNNLSICKVLTFLRSTCSRLSEYHCARSGRVLCR